MFHKIILILVDYIVKNGHIDPKSSYMIHSEIVLPDTDDPLSSNLKPRTFSINQKVNFGGSWMGIFPI